jgi:hypothetical protein
MMHGNDATAVWFSRGRGRGHAIPDLAIIAELRSLCPRLTLEIASYAVGADTFRNHGQPVIDLELPEQNDFVETLLIAARILVNRPGGLVIAHEEPAALVAAKLAGRPSVYLSHWFTGGNDLVSSCLRCADEIVFLEEPGWFDEPIEARGRVSYTGPIVRPLAYGPADRDRARAELGLAPTEMVILVVYGSQPNAAVPINRLVLAAFDQLPRADKTLVWIGGADREALEPLVRGRSDVRLIDTDWVIERWMVACDVAMTKATHNIAFELAALGVPSISISNGFNYMDDLVVQRVASNTALWLQEATPQHLADLVQRLAAQGRFPPAPSLLHNVAAPPAAGAIAARLDRADAGDHVHSLAR